MVLQELDTVRVAALEELADPEEQENPDCLNGSTSDHSFSEFSRL